MTDRKVDGNFGTEVLQASEVAYPLHGPADLDPLLHRIGDARIVLIGEAGHGVHESYDWRAKLTERLIAERGFSNVLFEADQVVCEPVDHCIKLMEDAPEDPEAVLMAQQHWPSWMLANDENLDFLRWLRAYNQECPLKDRVGWHGLDIYPLWTATKNALDYLRYEKGWSPAAVNDALDAPLRRQSMVPADEINNLASRLAAEIPARIPGQNAQAYYANTLSGGADLMNARAKLWLGRLGMLLDQQGEQSGVVVWAHNTHVGDGRGTDRPFLTLGQLARERYGPDNVVLIGSAGGSGATIAARERGAPMDVIPVSPPTPGSVEAVLAEAAGDEEQALFVFPTPRSTDWLNTTRNHRAIGLVSDPDNEVSIPTRPGEHYDAMIWSKTTTPLQALHFDKARQGTLERLRLDTQS